MRGLSRIRSIHASAGKFPICRRVNRSAPRTRKALPAGTSRHSDTTVRTRAEQAAEMLQSERQQCPRSVRTGFAERPRCGKVRLIRYRLAATLDLFRQPSIVFRPVRIGRVLENRLAETRRLCQPHVAANARLERMRYRPRRRFVSRVRKNSSTLSLTSVAKRVLASYMHITTPLILNCGFSRAATRSIVSSSLLKPCSPKSAVVAV